ncbi:MAG: phosphoribosylaminoimidazole-succinocarboxamide synthase [Candidatus Atribacteria bacterium]|uniref:phosphoribosylaminoimidazolesuccinocarboxamide synthase n=1 Tax=Atrimonas thermophila TaxID=3064161 RepID=UPI0024AC0614|nr:phosphoribosylaminoimidazole-succinocarboxamide synthase [Candidatus Atribacteria bacterium]
MGSVKDLIVLASPIEDRPGRGKFIFSDRYSVFDWGEMPDHIPGKGEALCLIGAYFFEKLEEQGMATHYLGLEENGSLKRLSELEKPSRVMQVRLFKVIQPPLLGNDYDYSVYQNTTGNFLIPFEFIYRNFLPQSSSFRKRVEKGEINLADFGLSRLPNPQEPLEPPLIDVSTKLEEQDRYLSWDEVLGYQIINQEEQARIKDLVLKIDQLISREIEPLGLRNEDGKVELAFDARRNLVVVDVVGTPDECRYTYQGLQMSKEIARHFYRQTEWYREIQEAKQKNKLGWKALAKSKPPHLPEELLQLVSWVYQRIANDLTGRAWFEKVPPLPEIASRLKQYLGGE